jgi:hypothetical protein
MDETKNNKPQPVAWMVESDDRRHFIFPAHQKPVIHEGETLTPLYTTPPAAQPAVPLTDKQLLEILVGIDSETKRLPSGFKDFARAIEAFVRADEQKKWESQTAVEIHEAVLDERQACAKICDEVDKESQSQWPKRLATMIRARDKE